MNEMRSAITAEPVLVDCPKGAREVRVRPVFRTGAGYAVVDSVPWEKAGELWESAGVRNGQMRKVWRGVTVGGTSVSGDTRKQAIDRLLDERDEFAVTIDDTNPGLF